MKKLSDLSLDELNQYFKLTFEQAKLLGLQHFHPSFNDDAYWNKVPIDVAVIKQRIIGMIDLLNAMISGEGEDLWHTKPDGGES